MGPETLRMGEGQSLEVVADEPGRAEVVSTWAPRGTPGPSHFHPEQDEEFEVLEGVLTVEQDGVPATEYAAGESFTIPRGAAHRMWNASDVTTRARWQVTPGLGTLAMWRLLDRGGPLAKPTVLLRHRREFRLRKVRP